MSQHQFNLLLAEIQRGFSSMADNLGKRISWLERIAFGVIGAVVLLTMLKNLGVLEIG